MHQLLHLHLVFILLAGSLNAQTQTSDSTVFVDALLGSWSYQTPKGQFVEQWQRANDSLLLGKGAELNAVGDTVFSEKLRLVLKDGHWMYVARVPDQNQAEEVYFNEVPKPGSTWYFENLSHDFPQGISYTLVNPNQLEVFIEGKSNNETHRVYFHFTRKLK